MANATFLRHLGVATLVLLAAQAQAQAQQPASGAAILAEADRAATQTASFHAFVELETVEADAQRASRTLEVWQKGHERRLVKITAPPRLRGVGMLSVDDDQLYLYLPAFNKTRRVAGRSRGERFFGSNFTQDDLSRTRYGHRFDAKLTGEDKDSWTLRLDPKAPADEPHHHLVITVRKSDHGVARVEFYDAAAGVAVRTVDAADFRVVGAMLLAHKVVSDDVATKSRSTATLTKVETDADLADDFFSKRQLQR